MNWLICGAAVSRAVAELALARLKLKIYAPQRLLDPVPVRRLRTTDPDQALIAIIPWAIGVAACRVPWRADCLVRACAAQHWLATKGVPSELTIGVTKGAAGFAAHAWLRHGDQVVVGGEIAHYTPLYQGGNGNNRP